MGSLLLRRRVRLLPRLLTRVGELARRGRGITAMSIGRVASCKPLDENWGFGTPIDRHYIETFLARCSGDVRGRVLEVQEDDYSRRFGRAAVTHQDILNLDGSVPNATIVGDLADPGTLPSALFDCVVLTQTLRLVFDMAAAIAQIRRSLRPGGVALITVPGITPILPEADYPWYWSLTESSLRRLLDASFDPDKIVVQSFGNLFAATAFLHAAAVEDVPRRKLDRFDPHYPVTIAARAVA
jgi:SAM-dependent methyltransferase